MADLIKAAKQLRDNTPMDSSLRASRNDHYQFLVRLAAGRL
jgi:hypothetical protein